MFKKFLKNVSSKELIWYIGCVIVIIVGLVFLILGIVGDHMPVSHFMRTMQGNFPWRYIGLIIISSAIIVFIIVLLVYGKKAERIIDREARRKQRLQAMMSDVNDEAETIIVNKQGKIERKVENVIAADTSLANEDSIKNNNDDSFNNAIIDDKKSKE